MKVFKHFNQSGDLCPICKTNDDKSAVLVSIYGTEEGNICQAMQIHLDCINLTAYYKDNQLVLGMVVN